LRMIYQLLGPNATVSEILVGHSCCAACLCTHLMADVFWSRAEYAGDADSGTSGFNPHWSQASRGRRHHNEPPGATRDERIVVSGGGWTFPRSAKFTGPIPEPRRWRGPCALFHGAAGILVCQDMHDGTSPVTHIGFLEPELYRRDRSATSGANGLPRSCQSEIDFPPTLRGHH